MMKDLEKWLQIGANLGILAGLILVGLQLQQNSDLLRTQLLYEESNRQSQFELAMLGEDPAAVWAKALTNPEALSLREQKIAETAVYLNIENWRSTYRLSQLGLIDEEWKKRVSEEASYQLNSPYGRALWKYIAPVVEEELALYVDTLLTDEPFNPLDAQRDIMSDSVAGTGRPELTEAESKKWLQSEEL